MGLSRRQFTKEFKLKAVQRLEQGVSIAEVARALEVNANVLHRWRREFREGPGNAFSGNGKPRWSEGRIAELERKIGQQALEIDFLKGCLQRIEEQRMLQALTGNPRSTGRSQEEVKANRGLTIERMVELGRVSRSGFYRFGDGEQRRRADRDMDLRDAIQRIALEWPCYGRPRITRELRRRGWRVNAKRVYRILWEDNLLCVRKRKFVVTTDSNHGRKVYPNLAREMEVTDIDQLWVADITYIRLQDEFVFLAVILDACSRRIIGWALERTLEDDLTLAALRIALTQRAVQPGLVHHSDRGSQYASTDYTDLLKAHGIDISMSRKGNPWDNAACESFMKSLKYEEVLRNEYRNLGEARRCIARFLEQVYNEKRLHSALGYRPPAEFEQALLAQKQAGVVACRSSL
jgi:putative transposase